MRICLLSKEYPPDTGWGGIGAYTYQIAHGLKEIGHEVEVVSLAATERGDGEAHPASLVSEVKDCEGITVHRVEWKGLLDDLGTILISSPYSHYVLKTSLALWYKFAELHKAKPFDVVEAPEHLAEGLLPALTKSVPLVIKLHTPHSKFIAEKFHNVLPSFDQQLIAMLERLAMVNANVLISPSENLADYVAADTGVAREVIEIVRNPVNANLFCPEGPQALPSDGRTTVLFVGRLEDRKGIPYLIDAIPQVVREHPSVRFVVVGADTNSSANKSSMLAQLKAKLKASQSLEHVTFVSKVPLSEMPAYYRSADICIAPSLYDNAPYTCLEAMSTGKAFIGTAAGGMPEYVENGKSGLIIPPADPAAITAALLSLLRNPAQRDAFGHAARQRVLENFHRTAIAQRDVEMYELAMKRHQNTANTSVHRAYQGTDEQCLYDLAEMLYSYHKMIYDVLYTRSIRFRVKHWTRLVLNRPKLTMARALARAGRSLLVVTKRHAPALQKIEQEIAAREAEREALLRQRLGCRK